MKGRLLISAAMVAFALLSYYGYREVNPVTGEKQAVGLSQEQEVALGLQAAPRMAQEMGGLDPDDSVQADVEAVGQRVVAQSVAGRTPYKFRFRVLADQDTVNAFALPGGPIFVTRGLLRGLRNEAQLAGVLGHEVGHVVARHSSEQIAKSQFAQRLVGAVGVAASDEQGRGQQAAQMAALVSQLAQLRYGRQDELQADALGVDLMSDAKYDPRALIEVMAILAREGGGSRTAQFLSSHPDPGNRQENIREAIAKKFPGGVPSNLTVGRTISSSTEASAERPR
ncbi:MAG TPA: M48 family metallopeptidase [Vicinamibacteria bacterium]